MGLLQRQLNLFLPSFWSRAIGIALLIHFSAPFSKAEILPKSWEVDAFAQDNGLTGYQLGYSFTAASSLEGGLQHLNVLYHFWPDSDLVPYVMLGLGATDVFQVKIGAGVKSFLTENILLRADLRYVVSLGTDQGYYQDDLEAVVAIGYVWRWPTKKVKLFSPMIRSLTMEVTFDSGQFTLTPESEPDILALANFMKQNGDAQIEIEGHTDNTGSDDLNLLLPQQRADIVKNAVIDLGVASGRLSSKGYGMTQPVGDNASPEGRAANRRVVARLIR